MDFPNRAPSTAAAANLILASLQRVARDAQASESAPAAASIPVFGIRWPVEVIRRGGSTNVDGSRYLNNLPLLFRNHKIKMVDYNRVSQLWANAFANDPTIFPDSRESWRPIIERFDLDDAHTLREWTPVVQWFVNFGILDTEQLSSLPRTQFANLSGGEDFADLPAQLWRSSVLTFTAQSAGAANAVRYQSESVESVLRLLRGDALSTSDAVQRGAVACQRLNVSQGFLSLPPSQKMMLLRAKSVSKKTTNTFFMRQSQLIALTGVRKVLPSFASWGRAYFSFRELRAVRPFPANGRIIIQWSSVSRLCLTFPNYVSYVKKVRFFPNEASAFDTTAARNVAKALKQLGIPISASPASPCNFDPVPRGRQGVFGLLAHLAYLFALRVPSGDPLTARHRQ